MGLDRMSRSCEETGLVYDEGRLAILVERSSCLHWLERNLAGCAFGTGNLPSATMLKIVKWRQHHGGEGCYDCCMSWNYSTPRALEPRVIRLVSRLSD